MQKFNNFFNTRRVVSAALGAVAATLASGAVAQFNFESPAEGKSVSGNALFSGWVCEAESVQIEFDLNGAVLDAAYGTDRADTEKDCGDTNNGFSLLFNFGNFPTGEQTVKLLIDGEEAATRTFNTIQLSSGADVEIDETDETIKTSTTLTDFPKSGHSVVLSWDQASKNFMITEETIPSSGTGEVFDNGVVAAQWDGGIKAWDQKFSGGSVCADGGEACPSLGWALVDDDERGSVLEVTYTDSGLAILYFEASRPGVDMSEYANGTLTFDVKVVNPGDNTDGWTMKVDCIYPCSSGDQLIGTAGLSGWETVTIPVSQLTDAGLILTKVNTGLVIFPNGGQQQGFVYRIDNVFWNQ